MCVRTEFVLARALCSILINLICNMTTFREKNVLNFDPTQGSRVRARTKYIYSEKQLKDIKILLIL